MVQSVSATIPNISLDDKWLVEEGRVMINGTQAIARVLLAQKALDEKAGLGCARRATSRDIAARRSAM